jgi:tetratricopeptide (TPR) repeat protein
MRASMRLALLTLGLAVFLDASAACAAEESRKVKPPDLGPAITQRLEKAATDLAKLRKELTGKAAAPETRQPEGVMSKGMASAVHAAMKELRLQADAIQVSDADMQGLELYARCQYDKAATYFEKSLAANPSKEFPAYFLGCIAFEQGHYTQAAKRFRDVCEQNKNCSTAYFLSILSDSCAKHAQPVEPLDMALLAKQAETRVNDELIARPGADATEAELNAWDAATMVGKATHGPIILRVRDAARPIIERFDADTAGASMAEKDVQKAAALALMVNEKDIRDALLARLTGEHPAGPVLQNLAFMSHYFTGEARYSETDSADMRRDLAAAVQRQPDNGALLLLQIGRKPGVEVQVKGQSYPEIRYIPLTDAETELLHRAANAPTFGSYRGFQEPFRRSYTSARLGGLQGLAWGGATSPIVDHWNNTKRRAAATMEALAKAGKTDAVLSLYRDAVTVGGRIVQEAQASEDIVGWLLGDAWRAAAGSAFTTARSRPETRSCSNAPCATTPRISNKGWSATLSLMRSPSQRMKTSPCRPSCSPQKRPSCLSPTKAFTAGCCGRGTTST